jgi:glucose/mannose-6-phosphate isomerase
VLPEVDHNEIEGWSPGAGDAFGVVVLRHPGEHPGTAGRVRASLSAIRSSVEGREATVAGDAGASALFSLILLGDYVSTYLALLRGVDPMPVPVIGELKERLRP